MRRSDELLAAGEVGGASEVEPESGVAERLRIALDRRSDVDRHLLAPVGALAVEIGEFSGAEGRADPPPQFFANRVDDAVGHPSLPRVVDCLQCPLSLLPLEEGVVEWVGHWPRLPRALRRQSGGRPPQLSGVWGTSRSGAFRAPHA